MKIRGIVGIVAALVLAWLIFLATSIVFFASSSDAEPADAAVVLGAAVWDDRPSPVFVERINHAVELYKRGQVDKLILTGGVGVADAQAESVVAREYAVGQGVVATDILIETESHITYENLLSAKSIMEKNRIGRILVVSDPLHMRRAITMAHDLGIDAHPSPTPTTRYRTWRSQIPFLLREVYFYVGYLLTKPSRNNI